MKLNKIVIISVVVVLVTAALASYWYANRNHESSTNDDSINYSPPTETEKAETDQHKDALAEQEEDTPGEPSPNGQAKKSVTPVISFWGQESDGANFELNGYVPGIVEKNGKCTATLTRGSQSVTKNKTALDDAQSTSCGLIVIPRNELGVGDWQLKLNYSSSTSEGSSETVNVTIK